MLEAQISLLNVNLKVAFNIKEPVTSLRKPPYEHELVARDVSSLAQLFPTSLKPDGDSF